jgi:hypothetical protein
MRCLQCDHENADDVTLCANCGAPLTRQAEEGPVGSLPPGPINLETPEIPAQPPAVPAQPAPAAPTPAPEPPRAHPVQLGPAAAPHPGISPQPVAQGGLPTPSLPPQMQGYQSLPQADSKNATITLVLGIVSLFCAGLITGIIALVIGSQAKKEPNLTPNSQMMIKVGMILGTIGIVLNVLAILYYIVIVVMAVAGAGIHRMTP